MGVFRRWCIFAGSTVLRVKPGTAAWAGLGEEVDPIESSFLTGIVRLRSCHRTINTRPNLSSNHVAHATARADTKPIRATLLHPTNKNTEHKPMFPARTANNKTTRDDRGDVKEEGANTGANHACLLENAIQRYSRVKLRIAGDMSFGGNATVRADLRSSTVKKTLFSWARLILVKKSRCILRSLARLYTVNKNLALAFLVSSRRSK